MFLVALEMYNLPLKMPGYRAETFLRLLEKRSWSRTPDMLTGRYPEEFTRGNW